MLSVGGVFLWNRVDQPEQLAQEVSIQPGKTQAVLVLSSGEKVNMGAEACELEERDGTALQVSENGQIAYHSGKDDKVAEEKGEDVMNRLSGASWR